MSSRGTGDDTQYDEGTAGVGSVAPSAELWLDTAKKLVEEANWGEVVAFVEGNPEGAPDPVYPSLILATARVMLNDYHGAVEEATAVYEFNSDSYEAVELLAATFSVIGQIRQALFYGKMGAVLKPDPRLAFLRQVPGLLKFDAEFARPDDKFFETRISLALSRGDLGTAEHWARQQVSFYPKTQSGYFQLSHILAGQARFQEATQILRSLLHVDPDCGEAYTQLAIMLEAIGQFDQAEACHRQALSLNPDDDDARTALFRGLLHNPQRSEDQLQSHIVDYFAHWCTRYARDVNKPAKPKAEKIRVGFFFKSMASDVASGAISKILQEIDGQRFFLLGFGNGKLSELRNVQFQNVLHQWHDITSMDAVTIAVIANAENLDIIVDLRGYLESDSLLALFERSAPLQISWTSMPLGTNGHATDAVIVDDFLYPQGTVPAFPEKPLFMEGGCQILAIPAAEDDPQAVVEPLPERETSFICDASISELDVESVQVWARILRENPNCTLAFRDYDMLNPANSEKLLDLFGNYGLAHRIDIIHETEDSGFCEQGAVALVPLNCLRPSSVVQILWQGGPVVAMAGDKGRRRLIAAAIAQLGLPVEKFVANTPEEYVALATHWMGATAERAEFSRSIRGILKESLQAGYTRMAKQLTQILDDLWQHSPDGA